MEQHLSALQTKHKGIEQLLRDELNRPSPDAGVIRDLKRRKLRIKDEISSH